MAELVVGGIFALMIGGTLYAVFVLPVKGLLWLRDRSRTKRSELDAQRAAERKRRRIVQRRLAEQKQRQIARIKQDKHDRSRINALAQNLQLAFQQLAAAPDAKRLRSWTHAAESLPLVFRRRQFSRFQPLLLAQISRWVESGVDLEVLQEDLQAITQSLGVASFEADYLLQQVTTRNQARPVNESVAFAQQLERIHSEHQDRLAALKRIEDLDEEIREELVEAEIQRYRNQLIRRPE